MIRIAIAARLAAGLILLAVLGLNWWAAVALDRGAAGWAITASLTVIFPVFVYWAWMDAWIVYDSYRRHKENHDA